MKSCQRNKDKRVNVCLQGAHSPAEKRQKQFTIFSQQWQMFPEDSQIAQKMGLLTQYAVTDFVSDNPALEPDSY